MGVTFCDRLHEDSGCTRQHYWVARRKDLAETLRLAALFPSTRIGKEEKAYHFLGYARDYANCFGDDGLRRRRFAAILRAEVRRRDWLRFVAEEDAVLVMSRLTWESGELYFLFD